MPTPEELLPLIAAEHAADPNRVTFLELAEGQVGQVFGAQRDLAVAHLAAHMLTLSKRQGDGGAIASRSEGGVSISYAGGQRSQELDQTVYGKEFKRLRRATVLTVRTKVDP